MGVALAIFVGASNGQPATAPKSAQLSPKAKTELMAALRQQVRDRLRDPDSAKFSDEDLRQSDDPPARALCGFVNAKNAYGGYVGKARFVSTTRDVIVFEADDPRIFPEVWRTWCSLPAT